MLIGVLGAAGVILVGTAASTLVNNSDLASLRKAQARELSGSPRTMAFSDCAIDAGGRLVNVTNRNGYLLRVRLHPGGKSTVCGVSAPAPTPRSLITPTRVSFGRQMSLAMP